MQIWRHIAYAKVHLASDDGQVDIRYHWHRKPDDAVITKCFDLSPPLLAPLIRCIAHLQQVEPTDLRISSPEFQSRAGGNFHEAIVRWHLTGLRGKHWKAVTLYTTFVDPYMLSPLGRYRLDVFVVPYLTNPMVADKYDSGPSGRQKLMESVSSMPIELELAMLTNHVYGWSRGSVELAPPRWKRDCITLESGDAFYIAGVVVGVDGESKTCPVATTPDFDVFLSHNSVDKPIIRTIYSRLTKKGVKPWLDEEHLVPGRPWQKALEDMILRASAAAVFVGSDGLGPWEEPEMRACLGQFVRRRIPVIPVLLPGAIGIPELPLFLQEFTWVDLRTGLTEEGIARIIWGITGEKCKNSAISVTETIP